MRQVAAPENGFEVDLAGRDWPVPADITSRLNQAFVDALTSPEVEACMATPIAERSLATQEQFGAFVDGELARHERVVKGSGAKED